MVLTVLQNALPCDEVQTVYRVRLNASLTSFLAAPIPSLSVSYAQQYW